MLLTSTFPGDNLISTYTSGYDPVTCDTTYSMDCNAVLNGQRTPEETICISLGLSATPQPVQFSNCGSSFDTTMRVYQNILDDLPISHPYCNINGDDCGACSNGNLNRENFIMPSLSNQKTIVLDAFSSDSSGSFQVEINCGDQIEYPIYESTSTVDPFDPSLWSTMDNINCDISYTRSISSNTQNYVTGYRNPYTTICIKILLASQPQDIQFSTCQSSFDTKLSVWEDIFDSSSVSYTACNYGDDDCGHCSNGNGNRENFVLYSLSASEYTIVLDAFSASESGTFKVEINCGDQIQYPIYESTIDPFDPSLWSTMDDSHDPISYSCDVWYPLHYGTNVISDNTQDYVAGYRYPDTTICIHIFLESQPQDIQFSTCESSFDTKLSVWEDIYILDASSVSYTECNYGDDDCGHCSNGNGNRENFVLYSLSASEYYIVLDAFSPGESGWFKIEISTGSKIEDDIFMFTSTMDEDTTTTVKDMTTTVEDMTTTEFECPNVNAGLFNAACQICLKNKDAQETCKDIAKNLDDQYKECFKEFCPDITCELVNINVEMPSGGRCDCSNFQCMGDGNTGSVSEYRLKMNMMVIVLVVGYFVFQSV